MEIQKAKIEQLPQIMEIYDDARLYMRKNGNTEQWGNGYPSREIIAEDIALDRLYVCMENRELLGVFCYFFGDDPTYAKIYDGAWLNADPYGVLHRIAVAKHCKGVASFCFAYCFDRCKNLKIDTHRDNIPMQHSLAKNGFTRCGVIYLADGSERIAFQKV